MNHNKPYPTAVICLSPYHGGMEMDAIRIAKLISKNTHTTLIVKSGSPLEKRYAHDAKSQNITIETITFDRFFSLSIIRNVRRIIKEQNIKNIIYLGASELRSLYFSFIGLDLNLIIRHGTTKSRAKKDAFHRLIYSNVNYHVAICEHLAKNVLKIIPFGKNTELKVIYSSLRGEAQIARKQACSPDRTINILHVGRIADGKGQFEAIEACHILYKNNIPFTLRLLGDVDPGYEPIFKTALEKTPYKSSIILEGFKSNVSYYYSISDIFLFPSKGEGLSNSFIEALSIGLICIAFDNTSFPELHDLGFKVFLAKDQDMLSLQNELMNSVKYLQSICLPVESNVNLAKVLFDKKTELDKYLEILK